MSSLITKTIEPATGTTVTLGAGGDTVDIAASQLKTNTVKDAGGNTLFTSDGAGTISSVNSALSGDMIFISSQDCTGQSSVEFTSGIDGTYDEYVFVWVNVKGVSEAAWRFQGDINGGSAYNQTITSVAMDSYHSPTNSHAHWSRQGASEQAQGTAFQPLTQGISESATHSGSSGYLHIFNPTSTTYIKQLWSIQSSHDGWNEVANQEQVAGYFNVTVALTQFKFELSTGNIATGTVYLYGMK